MILSNLILAATAVLTALMAGLFFAWSCSIMPGFARLTDKEFVSAMQATNSAIQNPIFFTVFFGAPLLLLISTICSYGETRFWLLLAATVVYFAGVFGVTVFGNVPLNNQLERFDLQSATDNEISAQRANFETRWNNLNTIRTVTSTIVIIMVVIACIIKSENT